MDEDQFFGAGLLGGLSGQHRIEMGPFGGFPSLVGTFGNQQIGLPGQEPQIAARPGIGAIDDGFILQGKAVTVAGRNMGLIFSIPLKKAGPQGKADRGFAKGCSGY